MKFRILLTILLLSFVTFVSAQTIDTQTDASYAFLTGQNVDLKVPCYNDGDLCSALTTCNLTILYPNSTLLIDNQLMTNSIAFHNYSLNSTQTQLSGTYTMFVFCCDQGKCDNTNFQYLVNPAGIVPSNEKSEAVRSSIWFFFLLGIIFSVAAFVLEKFPMKVTAGILGALFFLISLNIVGVATQDEVINPRLISLIDGLTSYSFIIYYGMAVIIIVIWAIAFFVTHLENKRLKDIKKFGTF